jgi:hypothetical protein
LHEKRAGPYHRTVSPHTRAIYRLDCRYNRFDRVAASHATPRRLSLRCSPFGSLSPFGRFALQLVNSILEASLNIVSQSHLNHIGPELCFLLRELPLKVDAPSLILNLPFTLDSPVGFMGSLSHISRYLPVLVKYFYNIYLQCYIAVKQRGTLPKPPTSRR